MIDDENQNKSNSILQQWRAKKKAVGSNNIAKRPSDQPPMPSPGQQRLFLLQQRYPESAFYQYTHRYDIQAEIDLEILQLSAQHISNRHESLRSNFAIDNGQIKIIIRPEKPVGLIYHDVSNQTTDDQRSFVEKIVADNNHKVIDLESDRLWEFTLIKKDGQQWIIILSMHHIIGDRLSLNIFNKELFRVYDQLLKNKSIELEQLQCQYSDFAHWQQQIETKKTTIDYWQENLSGDLPILNLPLSYKRPTSPTFSGTVIEQSVPHQLSDKITNKYNTAGTTPFVFFLAVFKILLSRYTNQDDIIVGSPFSNRDRIELENVFGFFNETVILRSNINGESNFDEILNIVNSTTLDAWQHKDITFGEIIDLIDPDRHSNINPIFQSMIVYNKVENNIIESDQFKFQDQPIQSTYSKFDITLFVDQHDGYFNLRLEYALELFSADLMQQFLDHYLELLSQVVIDGRSAIDKINILKNTSTQEYLKQSQGPIVNTTNGKTILDKILQHAQQTPNAIAVTYGNDSITYQDLESNSAKIAKILINHGAGADDIIGLHVTRNVKAIVGILGILRAGAAYLPLDPEYPMDRINYMLKDSKAVIVITNTNFISKENNDLRIIEISKIIDNSDIKDITLPKVDQVNLAYVIYTSGSTGRPKGIPITHANLVHSTSSRSIFYNEDPTAFLLLSSFSFDSSIAGIFWTLATGGNLVISPPRLEQDVDNIQSVLIENKITHTLMLPSLYQAILNQLSPVSSYSLKVVMVAGESCSSELVQLHHKVFSEVGLYNEYGPTEASVWCIAYKTSNEIIGAVPIGKPIPNTQAYILNKHLQLVPSGVTGELFIGGAGLANNYLNLPKLTHEKFIDNPYGLGQKIYRTGDMARWNPNGQIEFLGRLDDQIKIRGYRVELGEIKNKILQYPDVLDAEVIINNATGTQQIVAYVIHKGQSVTVNLKSYLEKNLPDYMVPSTVIEMDAFPLLPNGKLNKRALPRPNNTPEIKSSEYCPPQTEKEQLLSEIWQDILKIYPIGIDDNFFSIGGDSILSIQLISKARDRGILLGPNQIFENQTIRSLASVLGEKQHLLNPELHSTKKILETPLTNIQLAFLFNSHKPTADQGCLQLQFEISGAIDFKRIQDAWDMVVQKQDILRAYIKEEKQKKPLQIISSRSKYVWETIDLSDLAPTDINNKIAEICKEEKNQHINLSNPPVGHLSLVKINPNQHILIWICHHIFLDGWSCGNIIRELLQTYDNSSTFHPEKIQNTPTYFNYLDWKRQRDDAEGLEFWKTYLSNFKPLSSFPKKNNKNPQFLNSLVGFDLEISQKLAQFSLALNITQSTLFQGIWAIVLSKIYNREDILFGMTVSGRNANYPNITDINGLFMNLVPNRVSVSGKSPFIKWLQEVHLSQGTQRRYEDLSIDQILAQIQWPADQEIFETLFIYGNFMKDSFTTGNLSITNFEGGFSSTYPLSIRVNPKREITLDLRYDQSLLSKIDIKWISDYILFIAHSILSNNDILIEDLLVDFPSSQITTQESSTSARTTGNDRILVPPTTQLEGQLLQVWQDLFGLKQISVDDNYFDLGGKSNMAITMCAMIENKIGLIVSPTILINAPTIKELSIKLSSESDLASDDILIPFRKSGTRTPLFCFHAGGAHILFYRSLSLHLSEDRPIYSIQPPVERDGTSFPPSIDSMAAQYICAIKEVQPIGPYNLLGTCFSNAVVLEMAQQLEQEGHTENNIFIIDSAPLHLFGSDKNGKSKTAKRFSDLLKRGDFNMIKRKILNRFKSPQPKATKNNKSAVQVNLDRTIDNLNKIYAEYNWLPYDGNITLIRSSEFQNQSDKDYHIHQWKKLSNGKLEIKVIEGQHLTLFEEPEVTGLANALESCLKS